MSRLPIEPPPRPGSPWQWLYGQGHRLRARYYQHRARRLPRPVLSVGNLHWGGSGKTPMTAAIAAHLRDRGSRVAILSRGYGSKGEGVRIVSRGEGPLLGPRLAGDEPVLLAGALPGVAVVVCPDRYRAGRHALERLDPAPDVFLLDDGFSHLKLHRDLDLLVFPAADPFAGGRLPPSGRLREPLASARRAHVAVLTGHEIHPDPGDLDSRGLAVPERETVLREEAGRRLALALRPHGFAGPGFASTTEALPARAVAAGTVAAGDLPAGCRVLVVSAIARADSFLDTVRSQGFEVADHLAFGDHHAYPESSLRRIAEAFETRRADRVLTTGKDLVKLRGRLDLPVAEIPIRARPEPRFFRWLDQRLEELVSSGGGV